MKTKFSLSYADGQKCWKERSGVFEHVGGGVFEGDLSGIEKAKAQSILSNMYLSRALSVEAKEHLAKIVDSSTSTIEICDEKVDGKSCGREYDSEKYDYCYHCSVRKYAKRHGTSAAKRHFS